MNTNPSRKKDPNIEFHSSEEIQESIYPVHYPHHHEFNMVDGSETLDDAIRMKDQPFGETTDTGDE